MVLVRWVLVLWKRFLALFFSPVTLAVGLALLGGGIYMQVTGVRRADRLYAEANEAAWSCAKHELVHGVLPKLRELNARIDESAAERVRALSTDGCAWIYAELAVAAPPPGTHTAVVGKCTAELLTSLAAAHAGDSAEARFAAQLGERAHPALRQIVWLDEPASRTAAHNRAHNMYVWCSDAALVERFADALRRGDSNVNAILVFRSIVMAFGSLIVMAWGAICVIRYRHLCPRED